VSGTGTGGDGGALEIYRGSPEQTPLLKNRTFRAVTQGGQGGDEGGHQRTSLWRVVAVVVVVLRGVINE